MKSFYKECANVCNAIAVLQMLINAQSKNNTWGCPAQLVHNFIWHPHKKLVIDWAALRYISLKLFMLSHSTLGDKVCWCIVGFLNNFCWDVNELWWSSINNEKPISICRVLLYITHEKTPPPDTILFAHLLKLISNCSHSKSYSLWVLLIEGYQNNKKESV